MEKQYLLISDKNIKKFKLPLKTVNQNNNWNSEEVILLESKEHLLSQRKVNYQFKYKNNKILKYLVHVYGCCHNTILSKIIKSDIVKNTLIF